MKLIKPLFYSLLLLSSALLNAAEDSNTETAPTTDTASESTAQNERIEPSPEQQRQADLALAQNSETEVIWLENDGEQWLALYQSAVAAEAHGSIIIFPDQATGADWPGLIHPLRTQLTEHGWNTLAITLPQPPQLDIPTRTLPTLQNRNQVQESATPASETVTGTEAEASQNNSSTVTDANTSTEAADTYALKVLELAAAASNQLKDKGSQFEVVLGVGEGANWAVSYFMQDETRADRALMIINPTVATSTSTPNLLSMISELETPVLDLWSDPDLNNRSYAKQRLRAAKRSGNNGYRQIRLNQRLNDPRRMPLWLTKQVRGILKTNILDRKPTPDIAAEPVELTPGS